ncbi:integral membrane protein 2Bb [Aplochiton taeniatus]
MVKVSFNSALGQSHVKKDNETLIPQEDKDPEVALVARQQSKAWCWCMCLGLALMMSGALVGGAYLYRYYLLKVSQSQRISHTHHCVDLPSPLQGQVFVCGVRYQVEDFMVQEEMPDYQYRQLQESIRVLEEEQVELITVPVPEFDDSDPADIVHDFSRGLTAYLDLSLNKCYVIPLNTSIVMPPKDFLELLVNIKAGTYLPQSYLVHEEMMVTERLENVETLGYFINSLCQAKDTYKLQRRDRILGMQKREALNCRKIRHFGSQFVVETSICEP